MKNSETTELVNRRLPTFKNKRRGTWIATAVVATALPHQYARATNWIWTNSAGDASWSSTANPGNWINLGTGATFGPPVNPANVVFANTVVNNKSNYTIADIPVGSGGSITIPTLITVPTATTVNSLSFGDSESTAGTGAGGLQLSSTFTLGTTASTITLNNATGINRQVANGTFSVLGTSGIQTIGANITVGTANQIWDINGASGKLVISGSVTTTSSQTVTKKSGLELELSGTNNYAGSFIAQGGETLLDNASALGSNAIQIGAVGATAGASIQIGPGVNFANATSTVANASNNSFGVGGDSGINTWSGAITINTGTTSQGLQLNAGGGAGQTTFQGLIQDGAGATPSKDPVIKVGAGTAILPNANTFGGVYTTRNGTTVVGNAAALGTGVADVQVSDFSSANAASLLTTGGITFGRNVTVAGVTTKGATLGQYGVNPGSTTWNGIITLNQATALTGGGGTVTFAGPIQDGNVTNSGVTVGNGTVVFSGTNIYGGSTTIGAGTLTLASTGALTGAGSVAVQAGGFFGGSGSVAGPVNLASGGTLFTGSGGIGSLTAGHGITLASGSTLQIKIQAPSGASPVEGVDGDTVVLGGTGNVFSPGGATLQLVPSKDSFSSLDLADNPVTYVIVDGGANNTVDNSTFANLANGVSYSDGTSLYSVNYYPNEITLTVSAVPEPAGLAVIFVGTPLMLGRRRRRSNRNSRNDQQRHGRFPLR